MPDTTDPAASALDEAKRIADGLHFACRIPDKVPDFTSCGGPAAEAYWAYFTPARIAGLVAALQAALKPHQPGRVTILGGLCERHENHRHFSITSTEADGVRACPDCPAEVWTSCAGCGPMVSVDACPTRNSITAALAGKGAGDGQHPQDDQ